MWEEVILGSGSFEVMDIVGGIASVYRIESIEDKYKEVQRIFCICRRSAIILADEYL